jgi:diaminopimelate decarboxylase
LSSLSTHLKTLAERFDSPFYFYDLDALDLHLKQIKSILDPEFKVWYACKANPLSSILSLLKENGFGADVASTGELAQAMSAGLSGSNLIATGPAKSKKYLANLLDNSVSMIIIESAQQLKDLDSLCAERGIKQEVLLRVQLEYSTILTSVLGGSAITPFGLGLEDWKKVSLSEYANVKVLGLHCFQWGNILDINQLKDIWDFTIKSCVTLASDLGIKLQILDLGGGLGIDYQHDYSLPFSTVHELLVSFKKLYSLSEVWLELGRFTVAECGSYATKVIDIKDVRGKKIVVTEGGINHLARPALVNEAFPCETLELNSNSLINYSVHGPLCTALDHLGDLKLPSNLKTGDWLVFKKCGAYGFTESMPFFLCHDLPGEVVLKDGKIKVLREPHPSSSWNC